VELSTPLTWADARWHVHAACANTGPDRFYRRREADPLCSTCPAAEPCLWAAMALEQSLGYRSGIWGGTTPRRRHRIAASLPDVSLTHWYLAVVEAWTPPRPPVGVESGRAA
jgi:hypothetical protein